MINLNLNKIKTLVFQNTTTLESQKKESSTVNISNSLAYLAYKNRKNKGLLKNENDECPILYFGDEWTF